MKDIQTLLTYRDILLRKLGDVGFAPLYEHPEVKAPISAGYAVDSALVDLAVNCLAFEQAGEECPELYGVTLVALNLLLAKLEEEGVLELVGMTTEPSC